MVSGTNEGRRRWPCGLCDEEYATRGRIAGHRHVHGFCFTLTDFEARIRVPRHSHDSASLTLVLEGAYEERTIGFDPELEAGAALYKPAGEPHANRYPTRARTLLVQFKAGEPDLDRLRMPRLREAFAMRTPHVAALGRKLWRELEDGDDEALECGTFELLGTASEHSAASPHPERVVQVARDWLHACYRDPLDLSLIARLADVSPSYLARAFRAGTGRTIGEYQRHLRVGRVMRQLAHSNAPIAELALEAGFADQSHCTRVFSRHVGISPGVFRARIRARA